MKTILTFLAVLCFSNLIRGEPVAQQVGDIAVPPPADMVEISDYSDHFRKLASAYREKPFGLYYLLNEFKDIDSGARPLASRSAVGSVSFISNTRPDAEARFTREAANGEKDLARMKFSSADFQKLIQSGMRNTSASLPALKISVSGMAVLNMDFSRSNRKTVVSLVNSSLEQNGNKNEFTLVYCMGWQLVGTTSINLIYLMPLTDASAPKIAEKRLEEWMDAIEAKNPRKDHLIGMLIIISTAVVVCAILLWKPRKPSARV